MRPYKNCKLQKKAARAISRGPLRLSKGRCFQGKKTAALAPAAVAADVVRAVGIVGVPQVELVEVDHLGRAVNEAGIAL